MRLSAKPRAATGLRGSASSASLRPARPLEASDDPPSPPAAAAQAEALLAQAAPADRPRLEALLARLRSPEAEVRAQAARELHAVQALGLAGARPTLEERGRVASDPRMNRPRFATLTPAAAAADGPALDTPKAGRRLSFWQRRRPAAPAAQLPAEWSERWHAPLDAMARREWAAPHPDAAAHGLLAVDTKKFALALGGPDVAEADEDAADALVLEDWESYRFLYQQTFIGRPHALYLGKGPRGPLIVAIETPASVERKGDRNRFRCLALDKNGYHKTVISSSQSTRERLKLLKKALPAVTDGVPLRKPEKQSQLSTQMEIFEKKRVVHHAKFGLLYRKPKQLTENEVYSNQMGSPQFVAFLSALGSLVPLKGHTGFRGGLDVREDLTGTTTCFTRLQFDAEGRPRRREEEQEDPKDAPLSMEVMMHVGPLLPHDDVSEQQLHRKRHIGNDVVVVVFCEGSDPFNPEVLTSNYNHIFILVRPVPDDPSGRHPPTHYRVAHCSVRGVKPFRPWIPKDQQVPAAEIREWLLTKVLNAERAAMYAPEFAQKLSRTITQVVGSWADEF